MTAPVNKMKIDPHGARSAIVDETEGSAIGVTGGIVVDEEDVSQKTPLPARAIRNEDGTVTLPLSRAVTYEVKTGSGRNQTEQVSELTFHELTGADLRAIAQASEAQQSVVALARTSRISVPRMNVIFDQLPARDVKAASEIISFLSE